MTEFERGRAEGLLEAVKVCKQHGTYFHQKSQAGVTQENKFHEILFSGSEGGALACGETLLALANALTESGAQEEGK